MDLPHPKADPHGVQRLLEILRRQQDSSSSSASTSTAPPAPLSAAPHSEPPNPFASSSTAASPPQSSHDADAARRRTYTTSSKYALAAPTSEPFDPYAFNPFSASAPLLTAPAPPSPPKPSTSSQRPRDLSELSFAESLPILSTLSADKRLLGQLRTLRKEQHELERRLAKEYTLFSSTADKQYPNAKARAQQDETRRQKMLQQWDECVARQQAELVRAGVPGVKVSREKRETDKQKKVVGVLVEMMDEDGEANG